MKILTEFTTEGQERTLLSQIEAVLLNSPKNQHEGREKIVRYGWDYTNTTKKLADIPKFLRDLVPDCDSVTINEYLRGQRISPHIDSKEFGDIFILSLLAGVTMRFTSPYGEPKDFLLPRRSLAVMSGELRHKWKHETLPLEADKRISIVYRTKLT